VGVAVESQGYGVTNRLFLGVWSLTTPAPLVYDDETCPFIQEKSTIFAKFAILPQFGVLLYQYETTGEL